MDDENEVLAAPMAPVRRTNLPSFIFALISLVPGVYFVGIGVDRLQYNLVHVGVPITILEISGQVVPSYTKHLLILISILATAIGILFCLTAWQIIRDRKNAVRFTAVTFVSALIFWSYAFFIAFTGMGYYSADFPVDEPRYGIVFHGLMIWTPFARSMFLWCVLGFLPSLWYLIKRKRHALNASDRRQGVGSKGTQDDL